MENYAKFYYKGEKIIGKGKYKNDNKVGMWYYYYRTGELEQKGKFIKGIYES